MKNLLLLSFFLLPVVKVAAQIKYFTKAGKITFYSKAPLEDIEAVNNKVTCVWDVNTGQIELAVLMKGFEFERALMEEHFNENYIESDKFPRAEFKGSIEGNDKVNYAKDGSYPVKVKGKLTIHGETKDVETDGKLTIQGGKINAVADFSVLLADYKISIPGLVADKVSKIAKISVTCALEPLKG